MTTPASGTALARFSSALDFELDSFQIEACGALESGSSVLVAAPTGAGKTIVGEFAIYLALASDRERAFFTTPMKALSNQKYRELSAKYGAENVGLLTGDTSINGDARVVVMTTEVLRNMIYADARGLAHLRYVVMDEVHYLADRFRGAVWEEVIIHLPKAVRLAALSATVSNAEEFGDWLDTVRGNTAVIVSEHRPVPLYQHVLVRDELVPLFDGGKVGQVNPELLRLRGVAPVRSRDRNRRQGRHPGARAPRVPRADRAETIEILDSEDLLPAIFFIFSRIGCDSAVSQVRRAGVRLTTAEEREEIRALVDERTRDLLDEDLGVLGYWEWLENLERGVAAHHAGLLPVFKEVVEELFQRKLLKVVFATETLALGINMPARTVVLEKLEKFNGEARVPITAGEYTQLTGRAGRRGIDVQGHAVVQWTEGLDAQAVAALASRRSYPLNSSFRPSYNMAVNLIGQVGRTRARDLLESSFAQFQADRAVVGIARKVRDAETSLEGYRSAMECEHGDFFEYARLRRELSDLEKKNRNDAGSSHSARRRRQARIHTIRTALQRHGCHSCEEREQHARWGERYFTLERETERLRKQITARTGTVARVFDRVVEVLRALGYLRTDEGDDHLTDSGKRLRRVYGERDLLVSEALGRGVWAGVDAPTLAAIACSLVYEARRDERSMSDRTVPRGRFRAVWDETLLLWAELDDLERATGLPGSDIPGAGLAVAMHAWARGSALDRVLIEADMAAGDFVRWAKQTIDLLDQISVVADDAELSATARLALDNVRRGIVAYGMHG